MNTQTALTACLTLSCAAIATAQPVVLDDYSSDANFVAGNYQFMDVNAGYSRPDEFGDPPPSNARPDVSIQDGTLNIASIYTAGQMWVGGHSLSQVGDRVTVDIETRFSFWAAPGMFFDTDLTNAYGGAEIRYQQGFLKNDKLIPNAREEVDVALVFNEPETTHQDYEYETFHYQALVTAKDAQTITLRVTMTSDFFAPAHNSVTLEGSEVFFGPSSWWSGALGDPEQGTPNTRYTFHDNLTFIPAAAPIAGDLNADGVVTNADISAFVLALTDPAGYADQYPVWDPDVLGDFTGDGLLTNGDIAGFVAALTGGGATLTAPQAAALSIPEPNTLALLCIGGLTLTRRRRQ